MNIYVKPVKIQRFPHMKVENRCAIMNTVRRKMRNTGGMRMYQIGQKVVYGIHGVCHITGVEERLSDQKQVTYLVLEPVGQTGARFLVPTHNANAMAKVKPMLSREALEQMLTSEEVRSDGWIKDENQRKQTYRELISSGDRARLLRMVRTLYRHRAAQTAAGRKCHICDENFLRDAEKLLTGEIAEVMGLDPELTKDYLKNHLMQE